MIKVGKISKCVLFIPKKLGNLKEESLLYVENGTNILGNFKINGFKNELNRAKDCNISQSDRHELLQI